MKTITRDELQSWLKSGESVLLIDVLGYSHFQDKHIPGSINIPVDDADFVQHVLGKSVGKGDKIVVYCASSACSASTMAAKLLEQAGFTNVYAYEGGLADWEKGGLELVRPMVGVEI